MVATANARDSYAGVLADLRGRVRERHRALRQAEASTKAVREEYEKAKADLAAMESIAKNRGIAVEPEAPKPPMLPLTPETNGHIYTCAQAIDLLLANSPEPLSVRDLYARLMTMRESLRHPPANVGSVSTMTGLHAPKLGWEKVGQGTATKWIKKGGPR